MELLQLTIDTRTMKNLEPLKSNNPPIVYCTQWHHYPEDGKVGYKCLYSVVFSLITIWVLYLIFQQFFLEF